MASLKDLKNRIGSVKSTQKITKAMKMVAASKLRRAREAAESARPYAEKMEAMMASLAAGVDPENAPLLMSGTGKNQKYLLVIAAGDRGLCGAFNSSVTRAARARIRELTSAGKEVRLFCVGRKSYDLLRGEYGSLIVGRLADISGKEFGYDKARAVAEQIVSLYKEENYDVCTVVYSRFLSAISQKVTWQQLIPLQRSEASSPNPELQTPTTSYEYEPEEEAILADLLPRNVAVQLFKAMLENLASEQGARMTAMDNATRNAGDMIKKLTLQYNRTRQAAITKELIEIISGAEAV